LHVLALCASLCAALTVPLSGLADGGRDDVRREGSCSRASTVELRLRSDDDLIRVELEIDSNRSGAKWAVVLLHERRIAYRGIVRAGSSDSVKLRRTVPDWFGSDAVVARATGPRSESCRVSATL
jgi:hypothetical protein